MHKAKDIYAKRLSPRSPLVYEATRYIFLPLNKNAQENRIAKARLLAGMVEWCLTKKLSHLQCVVDMKAFPSWVELVPQTENEQGSPIVS